MSTSSAPPKCRSTLLAVGCAALLLSTTVRAQDLLSAYRFALADDRWLAAASSQVDGSRARQDESLAASRPHALLRAGTSWSDEVYRSPQQTDRYGASGYGIVLTQSIYNRVDAILQDQAALGVDVAELRRDAARQDLMLRVAETYLGVLQARSRERACASQLTAASAQRDRILQMLHEGAATQPDAEETQARLDAAQAKQIEARSELALRLQVLRQLAGANFQVRAALREDIVLDLPQPSDEDSWSAAARAGNFEVRAAELRVRHAAMDIERAHAASLPSVDLVGMHGRLSQHGGIIFGLPIPSNTVRQTTLGLQLTVPLATGGAIDSRARQALAGRREAEDLAEAARRQADLAARQAFTAIATGIERIRADAISLTSSRSNLRAMQLAFELGKRLNSDVLNAQQQLATADQRLQQSRYETLLAQVRLKAVAGTLDEAELERISHLLSSPAQP